MVPIVRGQREGVLSPFTLWLWVLEPRLSGQHLYPQHHLYASVSLSLRPSFCSLPLVFHFFTVNKRLFRSASVSCNLRCALGLKRQKCTIMAGEVAQWVEWEPCMWETLNWIPTASETQRSGTGL